MSNKINPIKGTICGVVAGTIASAAMDCYWALAANMLGDRPEQKPKRGDDQQKNEPSTQIIADIIAEATTGKEVSKEAKPVAGIAVHYATGIVWGGIFGLLVSRVPRLGLLAGLLYGAAIWLFLDELAIRLLNIAPDTKKVPPDQHLKALGAHFVYGSVTALATRLLLRALG